MIILSIGLMLFLGVHSVRLFADDWRTQQIERLGLIRWKLLYSLLSAVGLALIAWGYAGARAEPLLIWQPPAWGRHLTAFLTLPAFVLIAAAYIPGSRIKAALGHPMVAGVFVWAVAHLSANGLVADLMLFESFLIWSAVSFRRSRRRDFLAGVDHGRGNASRDAMVVLAGGLAWALFGLVLHGPLIGVAVF